MKKIFISLLFFIFSLHISFAYTLTESDEHLADTVTEKLLKQDASYRELISTKVQELIESWKYNERITAIFDYILIHLLLAVDLPIEENTQVIQDTLPEISPPEKATDNNNIDFDIVKNNWLDWNNQVRDNLWLTAYGFSSTLESSALIWSEQAKAQWEISHKRNPGDSFYDYNIINPWFADNGVVCENVSGITHTENIWWGQYYCDDGECSDELSSATNRAFDAYMAEKWTDSDAHYRSLTQPYFNEIWLWIAIDEISPNSYDYYLTIHYCTELVN